MKIFKKYPLQLLLFFLLLLYFLSRLVNLGSLPIFTDEAIYIRWAQIGLNDAAWRFISLTDGKQPLFIWLMMPLLAVFSDPLLAGRLVSVGAGLGSMIGLGVLSYLLFKNKWIAIVTAGLYVVYPMALVYDRMALYDSLVGTFAVWGVVFAVLLVRYIRLDVALLFGAVVGSGLITKSSAIFSLYLLPFTLLLFNWKRKDRNKQLLTWAGLVVVTCIVAFSIETILRLSPFYYIIDQKNATFVYPLSEWIAHPFTYLFSNLKNLSTWFIQYMNIWILLVLASFFLNKKYWKEKLVLVLYFLAPLGGLAVFGRLIYPRYIFFMTLPLLPLAGFSVYHIVTGLRKKSQIALLLLAFLGAAVFIDFRIITDIASSPLPHSDKEQYVTGWASGYGVEESVVFFEQQAAAGEEIYVATQGTFGLLPYALEIYLHDNEQITVEGFWPVDEKMLQELLDKSVSMPTYAVFYQPCPSCPATGEAPPSWPLEEVLRVQKPESQATYTVYRVVNDQ